MSKKKNKEFDIPRGEDRQKPTMRTRSSSGKKKLGRGFGDMMATPTPVEKQKHTSRNKAANVPSTSRPVLSSTYAQDSALNYAPNSAQASASNYAPNSVQESTSNYAPNSVPNSAPNPMDSFAPIDSSQGVGGFSAGTPADETLVGGMASNVSSSAKTQEFSAVKPGVATANSYNSDEQFGSFTSYAGSSASHEGSFDSHVSPSAAAAGSSVSRSESLDSHANYSAPQAGTSNSHSGTSTSRASSSAKTQQIPEIPEIPDTPETPETSEISGVPDSDEQLGMDEASIESVITGNPKSKSGVESRAERKKKRRRKKVKITLIVIAAIILLAGLVTGGVMLYTSDAFKIEHVEINGALHLTEDEVLKLANVPEDVTLLQVDTDTIVTRLKRDAWVQDVKIDKKFPDTLVINITERPITAIVEVPTTKDSGSSVSTSTSATSKNTTVRMWAISADKIWLMPIPDQNSEVGKTLNQQIYSDVAGIMHIVDVLPSVSPEIGCYCTDATLQCAIDVVASMTTELKSQVKYVKASDSQSATLILNNGVEVAVGTNEDMRDKERIVLELLQKHEGKISFINVRNINNPTWRAL